MSPLAVGFAIRVFDLEIRIQAGSVAISDAVERYLFPWLPRLPLLSGDKVSAPSLTFRIEQDSLGVFIFRDDGSHIAAASIETAIPLLQGAIDEAIVLRASDFAFVHAGVVAVKGGAILLPGLSHAGKSTLVAELVRRGATYFSDEYAVIDADGSVHPYPRALMLRNGEPEQRAVLPSQLAASVGSGGVPARLILLLKYAPGESFQVRKLNHSEALITLLQSTPQVLADAPQIFAPLGRVAASAVTYTGVRGEAHLAADRILAMADELAG